MKAIELQPSNGLNNSGSFYTHSTTARNDMRHNRLIQQPITKQIRNRLSLFLISMDSIIADLSGLATFVSMWSILQFIGPCLVESDSHIWGSGSMSFSVINIVSIVFHIVPVRNQKDATIFWELINSVISLFFFIMFYCAAYFFKKGARVGSLISNIIAVSQEFIYYSLQPIVFHHIGVHISFLIDGDDSHFSKSLGIACLVIAIIFIAMNILLFLTIFGISFTFRQHALLTIAAYPHLFMIMLINFITFINALASHLSMIPSIILYIISAIAYASCILVVYYPGSFVKPLHQRLIYGGSITGCLMCLLFAIYRGLGRQASLIELFVFIFLIVLGYFVGFSLLNIRQRKNLEMLDIYHDSPDEMEQFRSVNSLISCAITGVYFAHPICMNWSIFKFGGNKWPDSILLWTVFAKLVAIFPEQRELLIVIIHNMQAAKFSGPIAKNTVMHAKMIITQRESTLCQELKSKLSKNSKQVQVSKRKLRHIWDLVLQGNIAEMDSSISNAYNSVNKSKMNFIHLISQYPNNRFVARSYLRFLFEILGDFQGYTEWHEKVKLLQRGILVNIDKANILGLKVFPNLPSSQQNASFSQTESEIMTSEETLGDIDTLVTPETNNHIRDCINTVSIPSTNCMKIWSLFFLIVFLYAPAIGLLAYAPSYLNQLATPLQYIYYLSLIRSLNFQLPTFAQHDLFEKLNLFDTPNLYETPSSLGNQSTTETQLSFLITGATSALEQLNQFRSFKPTDPLVLPAHDIAFGTEIVYTYYNSLNDTNPLNYSLTSCVTDYIFQFTKLMQQPPSDALLTSPVLLNAFQNSFIISDNVSTALDSLSKYLTNGAMNIENLILFFSMFIGVMYTVIIIGLLIYQLDSLAQNQKSIYKCLIALPKNIVSGVAESLKILKTDDSTATSVDDAELNKQEENILKVFASAGGATSMQSSEKPVIIIFNILILACAIAIIAAVCQIFPSVSKTLRDFAPHLDYVLGASGYMTGVFMALHNSIAALQGKGIGNVFTLDLIPDLTNKFDYSYHHARYGGTTKDQPAYDGFEKVFDATLWSCKGVEIPTTPRDYYSCFSGESQINLFEPLVFMISQPIRDGKVSAYNLKNPFLQELWPMSIHLYDKFFFPMFDVIVPNMIDMLNAAIPQAVIPVAIILFLTLLIEAVIVIQANLIDKKMKFTLSLLLHCPPEIVLQTSRIVDILSGDFTSKTKDFTARHQEFFDSIVHNMIDSVIVVNANFIVNTSNKATERIFEEKLEGKNIKEFFRCSKFSENPDVIFDSTDQQITVKYHRSEDDKSFLDMSCMVIPQGYVITTQDRTASVSYNTLIQEERAKSDQLLSAILPPVLVKRVQAGEKNISFGVQSASVLFSDIVEFTPWCASNTAAMVMSTLNKLFAYFDKALSTHPTMTKIKCIGDCYMCAGGIFAEVNQPALHAREIVEFGLESIQAVKDINMNLGTNLRIRVGINTGGPLVAGVLGTEKPTFEIIGSPINMAQQMEHHGVPMKIHISRSVYELIYGGSFIVQERGQIEIKNGSVITYLVEPRSCK